MSQSRIDPAKLRVPGLTYAPLHRERLTRRLDDHPGRVILLSAPAGFGKTVLVAEWLATGSAPAAWISLDPLDEEPTRLAEHLAEGLLGMGDEMAPSVPELAGALRQVAAGDLAGTARLHAALEALPCDGIMVLDDLHRVQAGPALALVEKLVQAPRGRLRLVLVSRTDPPFALGRLRLSGELLEVRARELGFTLDEARAFFAAAEGRIPSLGHDDLAALVERTEGWPAGLRLAEISLAESREPSAFVASFTGTHRFVTEYLLEEALGRQTPELQRFLMESAVLDRFDAETCRQVLGDVRAGRRLDEVRSAGLFLVPLGPDGRWFRYHHLFGELLTHRLGVAEPERLQTLLGAASHAAENRGDIGEAMEYGLKMADDERLLELIDAHGLTLLGRSSMAGLRRWLGAVDLARVRPYPVAWCVDAWLRVITERAMDPAPLVARIETALARVGADYDPARRERARLHTHILAAYAARYRHRWADALAAGEAAEAITAHPEPMSQGFLTYNTARVRMALGEMRTAGELLEQALPHHTDSGNRYLLLATLGRTVAVQLQLQGIGAADEALETADTVIDDHGLSANPACSIVEFHRGWTHLAAHRLDAADTAFEAALEHADPRDFPEERGNALMGCLRVALERGALDSADAALTELAALSRLGNVDLFETTLELERARVAVVRAETDVGATPPQLGPLLALVDDDGPWTVLRETAALLALRTALGGSTGADDPRRPSSRVLRALADNVVERARAGGRGEALVTGRVAQALIGEDAERSLLVEEASRTAARRGDVAALHALGPRGVALVGSPTAASPAASGAPTGDRNRHLVLDTLTEREEEVLTLLFDGHSNKSLSQHLFVSVDTVKTHLKHIYAKLDVTSRTRAVARARALGFRPAGE